jgi:hypothetical protein
MMETSRFSETLLTTKETAGHQIHPDQNQQFKNNVIFPLRPENSRFVLQFKQCRWLDGAE